MAATRGARRRRALLRGKVLRIPRSGHFVHVERPDALARAVTALSPHGAAAQNGPS
jgi:pimeloyl-ACP methyl ester carboxylesterase